MMIRDIRGIIRISTYHINMELLVGRAFIVIVVSTALLARKIETLGAYHK